MGKPHRPLRWRLHPQGGSPRDLGAQVSGTWTTTVTINTTDTGQPLPEPVTLIVEVNLGPTLTEARIDMYRPVTEVPCRHRRHPTIGGMHG